MVLLRKQAIYTSVATHLCIGLLIKEGDLQCERSLTCTCHNVTNPHLDWVKCVHPGVDFADLRFKYFMVYNLAKGSSLNEVLQTLSVSGNKKNLLGLILVHHSNSTVLDHAFWDIDHNLSICVVSHTNGQGFLDRLQRLKVGEVHVSLVLESSVDGSEVTVVGESAFMHITCIIMCT